MTLEFSAGEYDRDDINGYWVAFWLEEGFPDHTLEVSMSRSVANGTFRTEGRYEKNTTGYGAYVPYFHGEGFPSFTAAVKAMEARLKDVMAVVTNDWRLTLQINQTSGNKPRRGDYELLVPNNKLRALAVHCGRAAVEFRWTNHDDNTAQLIGTSEEYSVLDDVEVDAVARERALSSLYNLSPSQLEPFVPGGRETAEALCAKAREKFDDMNDAIAEVLRAAGTLEACLNKFVAEDGRGHLIGGYDDKESTAVDPVTGAEFFIYRVN